MCFRLRLVGARMYCPSSEFIRDYVDILKTASQDDSFTDPYEASMMEFVGRNLSKEWCESRGIYNRVMAVFFKGENALKKLENVVGMLISPCQDVNNINNARM